MILFENSINSCGKQAGEKWFFFFKVGFSVIVRLLPVTCYMTFMAMERWEEKKLFIIIGLTLGV